MNEPDKQFEQRAKEVFDESVEGLDAATLSRLNRGRQAALLAARKPVRQWSRWIPATGAVAATVLVAVMVIRTSTDDAVYAPPVSDFELLLSEENIDMLEELEFYSWLTTVELDADGDVG